MEVTNNKKGRNIFAIISLLLIGSLIGNIILFVNHKNLNTERNSAILHSDSLLSVKLQVEKHFNEALLALNNYKTNNDALNSTLLNLETEVKEKSSTMEKLTRDNGNVSFLRKQLKDVKQLRDECETQVNISLRENENLQSQLNLLNKTLSDVKKNNEVVEKKLAWANEIKAHEMNIFSYKVVMGKQKSSTRAKKTNRLSVSFILAENRVVEAGQKGIHLVVYDPNKKILGKTAGKFRNRNTNAEQVYSSLKVIDFKNEEQRMILNYDTDDKLAKGKYKVEIYADGNLSGKKEFELR